MGAFPKAFRKVILLITLVGGASAPISSSHCYQVLNEQCKELL